MLQFCTIPIFLAVIPNVHLFKSNSSITIYHLVDELNSFITSELKQKVMWPSGNHFIGPGHRFAIHDRYCGDFSSIDVLDEPFINATYNKRTEMMVYQCDVLLSLKYLYFGFILDMSVFGQKWESSDVEIQAKENSWDVTFEVHVREDGFCKINFLDSSIQYLGDFDVLIEPQNQYIRQWILWFLTRSIVWSYFETWNEMLKGTVREEFKSPGFIEVVCKAFTSRNP